MTRLYPIAAIAGLGVLCAGCVGGESSATQGGSEPHALRTVTYACEGCGRTLTLAAAAPAPSC